MYHIAVHGLGYVGLTAAIAYAQAPYRQVLGYDPDASVVGAVACGTPRHGGATILGLAEPLQAALRNKTLQLTSEWTRDLAAYGAHVVAVPTEKNGEPWMDLILDVFEKIVEHGPPRLTIIIESTLTPGTMDRLIDIAVHHRRILGESLFLAAAPRRDWFADAERNLKTLPRIVGGVTSNCTEAALDVLGAVSDHIIRVGYREAELIKPLENALFHVQIMAAQEVARTYPHVDMTEVLKAVGTHWRLPELHVGFGTGGRCIPLGPKYIIHGMKAQMPMMVTALSTDQSTRYMIARALLNIAGSKMLLGIAYRADFRDIGSSPAFDIARFLSKLDGGVAVHDAMFSPAEIRELLPHAATPDWRDLQAFVAAAKVVILGTPHRAYQTLGSTFDWQEGQLILDALGGWADPWYREIFAKAGARYVRVGDPGWIAAIGAEVAPIVG